MLQVVISRFSNLSPKLVCDERNRTRKADAERCVEYSTQLEGMAVHAARVRRAPEHALQSEPDYVALEDPGQLRVLEQLFNEQYDCLRRRGDEPPDKDAFAVLDRMSSGDPLCYRDGALMARCINQRLGHDALVALVAKDRLTLIDAYRRLGRAP